MSRATDGTTINTLGNINLIARNNTLVNILALNDTFVNTLKGYESKYFIKSFLKNTYVNANLIAQNRTAVNI